MDIHGGNGQGQGEAGDVVVAAHETEQGVEGVRVEFLAGFAGVHRGDAWRNAFLVGVQFRRKIVGARRFEADFEPLIKV